MLFGINATRLVFSLVLAGLVGCQSIPAPVGNPPISDPSAERLLRRAAEAQGNMASLKDVSVQYDGRWLSGFLIAVQPILIDEPFRQGSQERLLLNEAMTAQSHSGPGGTKHVLRTGAEIQVWYNGKPSEDKQVLDAAALVADAYRMFLLGPQFFLERKAIVQSAGTDHVDGARCDQLLAILRPGIGRSEEDRVLVSIDQKEGRIRRVRFTLDGLESTRGAVADVYLRNPVRIAGVTWPTEFYEEVIQPVSVPAHHWRLKAIDFNRGLDRQSLGGPDFAAPATRPAGE